MIGFDCPLTETGPAVAMRADRVMVGGCCPVPSSRTVLCPGRTCVREGLQSSVTPAFNTDNRKEREVRGSHLWAPWFCAVTSQFATRAKNTLFTLRVMLVESNLHFTGRRGNSRLDNSHPAHPKILWALLADSGKLQLLIISVYSLSLALSSLHVPSFVFICFVFFCSHKCKICPFLKADSKLTE